LVEFPRTVPRGIGCENRRHDRDRKRSGTEQRKLLYHQISPDKRFSGDDEGKFELTIVTVNSLSFVCDDLRVAVLPFDRLRVTRS
jgi:hypothetical protein